MILNDFKPSLLIILLRSDPGFRFDGSRFHKPTSIARSDIRLIGRGSVTILVDLAYPVPTIPDYQRCLVFRMTHRPGHLIEAESTR